MKDGRWSEPDLLKGPGDGLSGFRFPEPEAAFGFAVRPFRVEYEVSGTGVEELSYTVGPPTVAEVVVEEPELPWIASVVMKGLEAVPVLSVLLREDGGQARAVIRVDGREALRGSASGASGTMVIVAAPGGLD